jgi:hypothetical protein
MEESAGNTMIPPGQPQPETQEVISRRHLLKILAATGGAVAAWTLLPGKWSKPVVEAGMLPIHPAQASASSTLHLVALDIVLRNNGRDEASNGVPSTSLFDATTEYTDSLSQVSDSATLRAWLDPCGHLFFDSISSLHGAPYYVVRNGTSSHGDIHFQFQTDWYCLNNGPDLCVQLSVGSRTSNDLCRQVNRNPA